MTKAKKNVLIAAIVLPLTLTLGSASALAYGGGKGGDGWHHGKHGGRGMCGGDMLQGKRVFRQLDLTDEQQDQMRELRQANRDAMKEDWTAKRGQMQQYGQQMQALLLADTFDENAVRELAKQMTEARVEQKVAMAKQGHEMLKILTPEQKTKLKQLQEERMAQCQAKSAE